MPDIAASDVTYAPQDHNFNRNEGGMNKRVVAVIFGDGALTYPSGGVPILRASFGMANQLVDFSWIENGQANGFIYKWDSTDEKIRIYQGDNNNAADSPLIELVAGVATPAQATLVVSVQGW